MQCLETSNIFFAIKPDHEGSLNTSLITACSASNRAEPRDRAAIPNSRPIQLRFHAGLIEFSAARNKTVTGDTALLMRPCTAARHAGFRSRRGRRDFSTRRLSAFRSCQVARNSRKRLFLRNTYVILIHTWYLRENSYSCSESGAWEWKLRQYLRENVLIFRVSYIQGKESSSYSVDVPNCWTTRCCQM